MKFGLRTIVKPGREPVALGEAKRQVLVTHCDEDELLKRLIRSASRYVENKTGRRLMTQIVRVTLDDFPRCGERVIHLPVGPVQSLSGSFVDADEETQQLGITYLDVDGESQTLDPATYRIATDYAHAVISEQPGESWPDVQCVPGAVQITLRAGYGELGTDVPEDLRGVILTLVSNWREFREGVVMGSPATAVPHAVDDILAPYVLHQYH